MLRAIILTCLITIGVIITMFAPIIGVVVWGLLVESPHEGLAFVISIPSVYIWNALLFTCIISPRMDKQARTNMKDPPS